MACCYGYHVGMNTQAEKRWCNSILHLNFQNQIAASLMWKNSWFRFDHNESIKNALTEDIRTLGSFFNLFSLGLPWLSYARNWALPNYYILHRIYQLKKATTQTTWKHLNFFPSFSFHHKKRRSHHDIVREENMNVSLWRWVDFPACHMGTQFVYNPVALVREPIHDVNWHSLTKPTITLMVNTVSWKKLKTKTYEKSRARTALNIGLFILDKVFVIIKNLMN